jgi:hypothetical protein
VFNACAVSYSVQFRAPAQRPNNVCLDAHQDVRIGAINKSIAYYFRVPIRVRGCNHVAEQDPGVSAVPGCSDRTPVTWGLR